MSIILSLNNICLNYGEQILLDQTELIIKKKQKISLIGRNGTGKSTLLKLIAKIIEPDSGVYKLGRGQTIAYLPQLVLDNITGDVFSVVASGLENTANIIIAYHNATKALSQNANDKNIQLLADTQQQLESVDGWNLQQQINVIISQLNLDPTQEFKQLSGGVKRRVLLGKELVKKPSLLLLDEPTNHLDITNILWLENLIKSLNCAVLLITHDRKFMQNVATNILELDRGKLTMWDGDYQNYLRRKAERENAEALENARFDKKLSQEEVWIRQGIKARRTRNEGRVRKLLAMRTQLSQRRKVQGLAELKLQQFENSGKLVLEAENINHQWDGNTIINDFSLTITRGSKIGIIGANGCGKSTLINILLGKIAADSGKLKLGTNLEIAYFDQLNTALNLKQTVQENISDSSDNIIINGKSRHINSYLQDFLFTSNQIRQPAKTLSGGERNRLMLAKLFAKPANFLILDEPTNDLDIETLDLLEELLSNFTGTVLLVSHDRSFLDNVVETSIIFETDGKIYNSIGGFSDWQKIRHNLVAKLEPSRNKPSESKPTLKLSFKQQQELTTLPDKIEILEQEINKLQTELATPELYQDNPTQIKILTNKLAVHDKNLQNLYDKWQELDSSFVIQ